MVKIAFFFSVVVTVVVASTASYSATINCERTTSSYQGYKDFAAFESWWPKNIDLDGNDFKEAGKGSKAMVYENTGGEKASGNHFTRKFRLLPNNVLIGAVKPFGNYALVSNIRYKCDINSNELRVKLAEGGAAPSTSSGTVSKSAGEELSKAEKMFDGHSKNALCHTATWVDGNRLNFWDSTDFSGRYPEGNYASLLAQHLGYNCNVGKYDKKIAVCHEAVSTNSSASILEWADKNLQYYTDKDLAKDLEKRVAKAKQMGLDCLAKDIKGVSSDTSSSSKIEKAKSTCTDLGFTAGTEKHGECVLKVMDN